MKRLAPAVWDALIEALCSFYWYKSDFERFLRAELGDHPELLNRLSFADPKRQTSQNLVAILQRREDDYQEVAVGLLTRLAEFDDGFPKLRGLEDGDAKVAAARAALVDVRRLADPYTASRRDRDALTARLAADEAAKGLKRSFDSQLADLRATFLEMYGSADPHGRGIKFEGLLNDLFALWDLEPRAAYNIDHEQIDGAFSFNTDNYLLEARWRADPMQPKDLNDFKTKVDAKAKNTLGLFIAVNGFTAGAVEKHSHSTPLVLMDGLDLMAVLEGRIALDDLLVRKRRHAAETGVPMLPVSELVQ